MTLADLEFAKPRPDLASLTSLSEETPENETAFASITVNLWITLHRLKILSFQKPCGHHRVHGVKTRTECEFCSHSSVQPIIGIPRSKVQLLPSSCFHPPRACAISEQELSTSNTPVLMQPRKRESPSGKAKETVQSYAWPCAKSKKEFCEDDFTPVQWSDRESIISSWLNQERSRQQRCPCELKWVGFDPGRDEQQSLWRLKWNNELMFCNCILFLKEKKKTDDNDYWTPH